MSNHTKGPWVYDMGNSIVAANGNIIADVLCDLQLTTNETIANLFLMAAAPDMLEALQAAKALLEAQGINSESRIGGEQFLKVQNAINKALGNG